MLVALYSETAFPELPAALRAAGIRTKPVHDVAALEESEPAEGWALVVVEAGARGAAFARRAAEVLRVPILAVAESADALGGEDWFDDFAIGADPSELWLRATRLGGRSASAFDEVVAFKDLELNLATYQATVAGQPIDLTYMEYELLRFLTQHQGRVWSREQLLEKVWGYDYFGGSRTVDVHVRRLRAKLGEERASWITTVRSVGYRFG